MAPAGPGHEPPLRRRSPRLPRAHRHHRRRGGVPLGTKPGASVEAVLAGFRLYGAARRRDPLLPLRPVRRGAPFTLLLSRDLCRASRGRLLGISSYADDADGDAISLALRTHEPIDLAQPARLMRPGARQLL